jgi:hypothetical protein
MDCSETIFVDEFWNFSTFSVVLLVLGRPELHHLLLTLECHLKTAVQLKECSLKASHSISRVWQWIYQASRKT